MTRRCRAYSLQGTSIRVAGRVVGHPTRIVSSTPRHGIQSVKPCDRQVFDIHRWFRSLDDVGYQPASVGPERDAGRSVAGRQVRPSDVRYLAKYGEGIGRNGRKPTCVSTSSAPPSHGATRLISSRTARTPLTVGWAVNPLSSSRVAPTATRFPAHGAKNVSRWVATIGHAVVSAS